MRERILSIDESIEEKATSLAEVHVNKTQLKIHLRPIVYDDSKGLVDKIPEGYNWTMDRRVYLTNSEELDYVLGLIEQSYKNVL